jgi:hypothetical protein
MSLVVTDRRWAATLSAAALGFGLFIGVAVGPGTAGSLATGAQQVIELPALARNEGGSGAGGGGGEGTAVAAGPAVGAFEEEAPLAFPSSIPLAPEAIETPPPAEEVEPAPAGPPAEEAESEAEPQKGIVVEANPAAGSYALAITGGELVSVHAPKLPVAGTKLSVPLTQLANGTFAEQAPRKQTGKGGRAGFNGTVTYLDPDPASPSYTVSGRGASVLVHVHPDPTGAAPQLPALGAYATVTVDLEKPVPAAAEPPSAATPPPAEAVPVPTCAPDPTLPLPPEPEPGAILWQRQVKADGTPSTYLELAGTVNAICPEIAQLLLSADGSGTGDGTLTLKIPDQIDPSKLELGDSYLATATIDPDSSLTLSGIAGDEHMKGAEDPSSAQGDLKRSSASASTAGGGGSGISGG